MLPFLKRKEGSVSSEVPQILISPEGETRPDEQGTGQGNDEFLSTNEGFLELLHSIVIRHLTRMR